VASPREPLPIVYAFAFSLGLAIALVAPVGQAIIINTVPKSDIASAISLQSVGVNLSRVAGPAVAVPILLAWGPAAAGRAPGGRRIVPALDYRD
jgi:MFS family permease